MPILKTQRMSLYLTGLRYPKMKLRQQKPLHETITKILSGRSMKSTQLRIVIAFTRTLRLSQNIQPETLSFLM